MYKQVYKQRFKPEETREAVLVNQKLLHDRVLNNHLANYKGGSYTLADIQTQNKLMKRANKVRNYLFLLLSFEVEVKFEVILFILFFSFSSFFQQEQFNAARLHQYHSVHVGVRANKLAKFFKHRDPLV